MKEDILTDFEPKEEKISEFDMIAIYLIGVPVFFVACIIYSPFFFRQLYMSWDEVNKKDNGQPNTGVAKVVQIKDWKPKEQNSKDRQCPQVESSVSLEPTIQICGLQLLNHTF